MRIYLTSVTEQDGRNIVKWRNSPKVLDHCFSKTIITEESQKLFYKNKVLSGKYKQFIVNRIDDEYGIMSYPIGVITLKDMDLENNRCEMCVFTSDDEEWNTDSQSIAIRMLLSKAFTEYKMNKVYTYAFSANTDEIQLLKRAGFSIEAELKNEARLLNGEYCDVYRMAIFVDSADVKGDILPS